MSNPIILVNGIGVAFGCVRMLIGAFSVIYLLSKGLSLAEVGWIKAFQGAVIVFVDIPLSHFSDKYSRKFSICLSIFCAAIWLSLTGIADSVVGFLVAEFFNALSLGLMSGTYNAYLYDISQKQDKDKSALQVFARYQKYHYLFMSVFSLLGSVIYYKQSDQVWLIASMLMILVFILSLRMPKDHGLPHQTDSSFAQVMTLIFGHFFGRSDLGKRLLYTNLVLALMLQILIQYWQVFIYPKNEPMNHEYLFGIAFSLILLSQSASGVFIGKVKQTTTLLMTLMSCSLVAIVALWFSNQYWHFSMVALCVIFFCVSALSSISLAKVVENCPAAMRSTLLSSTSVFSKLLMLAFMPTSAYVIDRIGIGYLWLTCGLILLMLLIIKPCIVQPA